LLLLSAMMIVVVVLGVLFDLVPLPKSSRETLSGSGILGSPLDGNSTNAPSSGMPGSLLNKSTDAPSKAPNTGTTFLEPISTPSSDSNKAFQYTECISPDALGFYQELYRGSLSTTLSGYTCQRWDEQLPQPHYLTPESNPNAGLAEGNYCRNPDNSLGAWCFTTEPTVRYELCALPTCDVCGTASKGFADFRGKLNVTSSGKACQDWSPFYEIVVSRYPNAGLERNYCRNPFGDFNRTWCYVYGVAEACNVKACEF
jgi:hypothetical protein